ncbi:MAG: acyl-CoA dehydrogenase family protein, partial [Gammaproteobacteria bacterium]|nr:acyl-CoA dehydrogenase family protein [Gammaproteobacteria bacterium]
MPQNSAPASTDSAIPTPAELAAAAESLAPLVRANAVLAEELRDPVPEVVDALRKAGLHKLYRPRRFGGYGLDWGPHFTVSERLARECGSTGWLVSLVFSHVMYLGRF